MRVVCTAGHVDHGKSALVRALTGMEPDRLAEERRRGLTLDLGFAWTALGEETVAFVDLPGHERYVPTMLAGAGAVELALFVVAADEGWKPQSAEHLAILDLLGVRHAVVALTKCDLADPAPAAAVVAERLHGTGLEGAAVVPVSAVTGAGLDALRAALGRLLAAAPAPADHGRPRLWVDRSFSVRGAGTVVTGTLTGGALHAGGTLAVLPGRRSARVRGLQALGEPVDEAGPGTRVAVNLAGVAREEVHRGDALGLAGQWREVTAFDALVRTLAPIDRRGAWRLHTGSAERAARLHPLDGPRLEASDYARIELDAPLPLAAGDRFILRDTGPRTTPAGGTVLDAAPPPRPRGTSARHTRHAQLEARATALAEDAATLVPLTAEERGTTPLAGAAAAAGVPEEDARRAADAAGFPVIGEVVVARWALQKWGDGAVAAVERWHLEQPMVRAAPVAVAVGGAVGAGCPQGVAGALVASLARDGRLVTDGVGVRAPEHVVRADPAVDALLAALAVVPFAPPPLGAAAAAAGVAPARVRELEAEGVLVRLGPDLAVTGAALELAVERLADGPSPFTAGEARTRLGTTRRFALPLLEELDRRGRTRRRGDLRDLVG